MEEFQHFEHNNRQFSFISLAYEVVFALEKSVAQSVCVLHSSRHL
jgi:hypothetical protein